MIVIVEVNIVHDLNILLPKTDRFLVLVSLMHRHKKKEETMLTWIKGNSIEEKQNSCFLTNLYAMG
jgi:hypothetical protein